MTKLQTTDEQLSQNESHVTRISFSEWEIAQTLLQTEKSGSQVEASREPPKAFRCSREEADTKR